MSITAIMLGVHKFKRPRRNKPHHTSDKTAEMLLSIFDQHEIVTSSQINEMMNYQNSASETNAMLRLEAVGMVEHAGYLRINRKPVSTWKRAK